MRHLLSILDLTVEEIDSMIATAQDIQIGRASCRERV